MTAPARHAGGRPRLLSARQVHYAGRAQQSRVPISVIARTLACGRATVYRALWPPLGYRRA
jgi:hypothetical protein